MYTSVFRLIKEQLKPLVKTEQQFLYVCHLIGPFLQRFHQERAYCCIDVSNLFAWYRLRYILTLPLCTALAMVTFFSPMSKCLMLCLVVSQAPFWRWMLTGCKVPYQYLLFSCPQSSLHYAAVANVSRTVLEYDDESGWHIALEEIWRDLNFGLSVYFILNFSVPGNSQGCWWR